MKRVIIGVTGASGSVLAKRVVEFLHLQAVELHLIISDNGKSVFLYETGIGWDDFIDGLSQDMSKLYRHANDDLFACVSSGSYPVDVMIILPCSMSTAGRIAHGVGDNLLCRAADVCVKERRRLVLVPRETPLSTIHLENLSALSKCGVIIAPPMPAFYSKRQSWDEVIDEMAGRILACAGFENKNYTKWGDI